MVLANIIWPLVSYFIIFKLGLTIVKVVVLMLKHATALRLSSTPEDALIQAELDFQEADMDWKIQEYLKAFTPEASFDTIPKAIDFIMATNLGLFLHSCMTTNLILVFSKSSCIVKTFANDWGILEGEGIGDPRLNCTCICIICFTKSPMGCWLWCFLLYYQPWTCHGLYGSRVSQQQESFRSYRELTLANVEDSHYFHALVLRMAWANVFSINQIKRLKLWKYLGR